MKSRYKTLNKVAMDTHDFIQEKPNVGKLGLYRVYQGNIIARIASPSRDISNEDIAQEVDQVLYEAKSDAYHVIIDVRNFLYFSRDCRNWMKTDLSKEVILSYALVATNPIIGFIARMALKAGKLNIPHAFFNQFDAALSWTEACKAKREDVAKAA